MISLDSILKIRDITLPTKVHLVKAMVFRVVMYGCESWTIKVWRLKNLYFWAVVLEKALESPLDCREIHPVHPKEDQSWVFIGRTGVEAETLILWPPDSKSWLIGKTLMLGEIEGRRRRGQQNEMVGWHHRLNGHGFGWTPGIGDGQGGLACCNSWSRKESDTTERLNWNELKELLLWDEIYWNYIIFYCYPKKFWKFIYWWYIIITVIMYYYFLNQLRSSKQKTAFKNTKWKKK